MACEPWVSIRNNHLWKPMVSKDGGKEYLGYFRSSSRRVHWLKMCSLTKMIHKYNDGIMSLSSKRQLHNEVHGDFFLSFIWSGQWLKEASRHPVVRFVPLTDVTCL